MDSAAKKAYSSASARATDQQASAVMHVMNNFQHAFVLFGCGTGKSGIYILQQLVCCMYGVNRPKSIVISPHNALLAMHHMQATKYFLGTSLRVEKLLPKENDYFGPLELAFALLDRPIRADDSYGPRMNLLNLAIQPTLIVNKE